MHLLAWNKASKDEMMATLSIPDVLKPYTNVSQLDIPIETLDQLPSWLGRRYPELHSVLFLDNRLNGYVNLYLDNSAVTHNISNPLPISKDSTLKLVTSISGG